VIKPALPVEIALDGVPAKSATVTQYIIDDKHSNSYEVWKKMGSPQNPSKEQIAALEKAGQLEKAIVMKNQLVKKGKLIITTPLAQQAVVLLKIDW
jgi:xylan 1,4-beta-xylosidase